jgi:hypothetical protein
MTARGQTEIPLASSRNQEDPRRTRQPAPAPRGTTVMNVADRCGIVGERPPRELGIGERELAAFIEVVDRGGFARAADALFLSQPGISDRINRLERSLGVVLIDRSSRRITLTRAGTRFLPYARGVVGLLARAYRDVRPHDSR